MPDSNSPPRFAPGEVVDITIKGVRVREQDADGCVTVLAEARDGGPGSWSMPPQAAITHVAPAEFPPRPGDLWRDRYGDLWFAVDTHDVMETEQADIWMIFQADRFRRRPDEVSQGYGRLTLVHREDEPTDALTGLLEQVGDLLKEPGGEA